MLLGVGGVNAEERLDGHFASWDEVPEIIESTTVENYREPLDKLKKLTNIQLGTVQVSLCLDEKEHDLYMLKTKADWQSWWKTTGESVSEAKKRNAAVDEKALKIALEFLEVKPVEKALPVWIPKTWSLNITFTNGDYGGRVKEIWMIERVEKAARFTRLKGSYGHSGMSGWGVKFEKLEFFTPTQADQLLRAICYVNQYAPKTAQEEEMKGLYYAGATMSLRNGEKGILWNLDGLGFSKSYSASFPSRANVGRSYYFLHSRFKDTRKWKELIKPSSEDFAPYRRFLSDNKPYLCSVASEVVLLFGDKGGELELEALKHWAGKQKEAIKPDMDWQVCCDYFGTGARVNIRNFTRLSFEGTVKEIIKLEKRLGLEVSANLQLDVMAVKELEKKEEEADIMRHPQPLRDLVRTDRLPNDSDLKHLSKAVDAIRKNPDPKLFRQLVVELDDGTLAMRSLLTHILLNEHDILDLEPWGVKEEQIAVFACIDALPQAKANGEIDDLVVLILKVCKGGKIEVDDGNGGSSIELKLEGNGYSEIHSGATQPLRIKDAQKELKRLYLESKKK